MTVMLPAAYVLQHITDLAGLVALAALAWVVFKSGGGSALSVLQEANKILEGKVHDLEHQAKEDQKMIAVLKARTDITEALSPLISWTAAHESRAQARAEAQLRVLEQLEHRISANGSAA